jgi:hypothetical protein
MKMTKNDWAKEFALASDVVESAKNVRFDVQRQDNKTGKMKQSPANAAERINKVASDRNIGKRYSQKLSQKLVKLAKLVTLDYSLFTKEHINDDRRDLVRVACNLSKDSQVPSQEIQRALQMFNVSFLSYIGGDKTPDDVEKMGQSAATLIEGYNSLTGGGGRGRSAITTDADVSFADPDKLSQVKGLF